MSNATNEPSRTLADTPRAHGTTPRSIWPGIVFAVAVGLVSMFVSDLLPGMSALLVAILVGVVLTNVSSLPRHPALVPGMAISSKRLLRIGIVLLGLKLSLSDVLALGPGGLLLVLAVVVVGFVTSQAVGALLGVRRSLRTLVGAGVSICGAAAVAGVEGVVKDRKDEEVVTALALVVVFGTLMIPLLPALAGVLGFPPEQAGLWIGAATHEVAQVVAGAGIIGPEALSVAVVVKLARVVMLAPMVALLSWDVRRSMGAETREAAGARNTAPGGSTDSQPAQAATKPPLVPLFVVGFLAAAAVRTTGVLPAEVLDVAVFAQTLLLAAAMFALGCGVTVSTLRTVGGRPVILAAVVTLAVVLVGLVGALVLR